MGMDSVGNFTGRVNFSGTGTLTMGGQVYTVINTLGSGAADTTAGTLQGVQANLSGHYALGSNIDAAATSRLGTAAPASLRSGRIRTARIRASPAFLTGSATPSAA
jgi:hypothetical protein